MPVAGADDSYSHGMYLNSVNIRAVKASLCTITLHLSRAEIYEQDEENDELIQANNPRGILGSKIIALA